MSLLKKSSGIPLVAGFAMCFNACGDSSTSSDSVPSEGVLSIVETFEGLTPCSEKYEGSVAYVKDDKLGYVCSNGEWIVDEDSTEAEEAVESSSSDSLITDPDSSLSDGTIRKDDSTGVYYKYDEILGQWVEICGLDFSPNYGGGCTTKREGEVIENTSDTYYYLCENGCWRRADLFEYDTYGLKCSEKKVGQIYKGLVTHTNRYYCSDSGFISMTPWSWDIPKEARLNSDIEYGTMEDKRDGQIYKTVVIGDQTWMAENLNYADSVKTPSLKASSWCYENKEEYCAVAGRLYTWTAAIDSVALANDAENPKNCGNGKTCIFSDTLQGICPEGWHLPSYKEWVTLAIAVDDEDMDSSGTALKTTTGWYASVVGTDTYGFSVFPAGRTSPIGEFSSDGNGTDFWTRSEYGNYDAYYIGVSHDSYVDFREYAKTAGFSVRCVKNPSRSEDSTEVEESSSSDNSDISSSSSSIASTSSSSRNDNQAESSGDDNQAESSSDDAQAESSSAVPSTDTESSSSSSILDVIKVMNGTVLDSRNAKIYKTVTIGTQTWMAQNLNYDDSTKCESLLGNSWCYKNDADSCDKYGRLYTWAAAIDSVALANDTDNPQICGYGKTCTLPDTVQGICPNGWHLPRISDWNLLFRTVGGISVAAAKLKYTSGWSNDGSGEDAYGFSALPAGVMSGGSFYWAGAGAYFWEAVEADNNHAYYVKMEKSDDALVDVSFSKSYGFSVRCIRN